MSYHISARKHGNEFTTTKKMANWANSWFLIRLGFVDPSATPMMLTMLRKERGSALSSAKSLSGKRNPLFAATSTFWSTDWKGLQGESGIYCIGWTVQPLILLVILYLVNLSNPCTLKLLPWISSADRLVKLMNYIQWCQAKIYSLKVWLYSRLGIASH